MNSLLQIFQYMSQERKVEKEKNKGAPKKTYTFKFG
jgi:hypothetical protein